MNKPKMPILEELETFGSNFTPRSSSLYQSKTLSAGGIQRMFTSVKKPQVPNREDWWHLGNRNMGDQNNGSLVTHKNTTSSEESREEIEDETNSSLRLRLEAMTWAAMAKDATILALQQRLKIALMSLRTEQDANAQLKTELEMIVRRNGVLQQEVSEMRSTRESPQIVDENSVQDAEANLLEPKGRSNSQAHLLYQPHQQHHV